jgi:Ca2+-binding RTX toxin-like protein
MSQASALEQYLLELINAERARAGVQPLALDDRLNAAAEAHSQWMIGTDTFTHAGAAGSTPGQRMTAAGYPFTGAWSNGENIAWATTRSPAGMQDEVQLLHTNLMGSPPHRANLLSDTFREIGLGFEVGEYLGRETAFVTENFARSGSDILLTGVAFADRDADGRYDPGEGLEGLTVAAVSGGARYATTTKPAGGYDLALPPGAYSVSFSGSGYAKTTLQTTIGASNVKLDLRNPAAAGSAGPGEIVGSDGDDRLLGTGADDRISGRAGNDVIDGGGGHDTVMYAGPRSDYTLTWTASGATVASAREGTDRLVEIERIQFSDRVEHITTRPLEYIASYEDLCRAFGADAGRGFDHFLGRGHQEGRQVTFDGLEYIASHVDLIAAFGVDATAGAAHYVQHGRSEGRTVSFDALEYIASYGDLIAAFGASPDRGAQHYIVAGLHEGRVSSFDPAQYLASYADLRAAFGTDAHAATVHFILHGYGEGRTDDAI